MSVGVVDRATVLGELQAFMRSKGLEVEEVNDLDEVREIIEAAEKPYLTPMSSPCHNDFTQRNVLWLVARRDGDPVYLGCARLEDIGSEDLGRFWGRVFKRAYGGGSENKIRGVRSRITSSIGGKMVYFGDLYVSPKGRGDRLALRAFVALGHLAVSLKWEPDWTYCFVRERDALRGAAMLYGFCQIVPDPFTWIDPPSPRENSEWLALLPKVDLMSVVEAVRDAVRSSDNKERKVQHQPVVERV